jgi:LysW-gamma-L-lysine carboxypeptidase
MLQEAVSLLKYLIETPSVSGSECTVAKLLYDYLNELGHTTHIDDAGNVICQIGNGKPRILLCGHMDTVQGQLPVTFEKGVITGRGSVDAKGPLAALIVGGLLAFDNGFTGSLVIAGVVDEEAGNKGIKQLIKDGYEVDYAVFGEPTNVNTITIGYKGSVLIKFDIQTQQGHSSAPWIYTNAIEKGIELFLKIKDASSSLTEENEGINALTTTIRRISGGESFGVNPSHCQLWIEFRVPLKITTDNLLETVNYQLSEFQDKNEKISIEMNVTDRVEPYTADNKNSLVRAFTRTIYAKTRSRVILMKKSGTGDMNYYGAETQIPCITYGPGDPHLDHTENEHIKITDYLRSIEIIKQALLTIQT